MAAYEVTRDELDVFLKDEIVLVANSKHAMTKRNAIKPEELMQIPLLLREQGSGTLDVIAHALKPLGIKLNQLKKEMQLNGTESMKQYLHHADCMAFLSKHSIQKELKHKEFAIIPVKGLQITRNFYFIQSIGQPKALTELFIKFALRNNLK